MLKLYLAKEIHLCSAYSRRSLKTFLTEGYDTRSNRANYVNSEHTYQVSIKRTSSVHAVSAEMNETPEVLEVYSRAVNLPLLYNNPVNAIISFTFASDR